MMHSRPYFILLISLFLSAITLWCAEAISFNEHITDKIYSWLPFIYFNTNPIPALGFPDVQTLLSSLPIIFTFWIHITLTTFLLIYCLYKPLLENIIKLKYFTALNLVLIILIAILLTNNLSTIYFIVAIIITVNALVRLAIKQDHTATISLSGAWLVALILSQQAIILFPLILLSLPFLSPWKKSIGDIIGFSTAIYAPAIMALIAGAYIIWQLKLDITIGFVAMTQFNINALISQKALFALILFITSGGLWAIFTQRKFMPHRATLLFLYSLCLLTSALALALGFPTGLCIMIPIAFQYTVLNNS